MYAFVMLSALADSSQRSKLLGGSKPNYGAYNEPSEVLKDKVRPEAKRVIDRMAALKIEVYYIADRDPTTFDATQRWLDTVARVELPDGHLLMAPPSNLMSPKEQRRQQIMTVIEDLRRDRGMLFFPTTHEDAEVMAEFGPTFMAPGCFDLMFTVVPPPEEAA